MLIFEDLIVSLPDTADLDTRSQLTRGACAWPHIFTDAVFADLLARARSIRH